MPVALFKVDARVAVSPELEMSRVILWIILALLFLFLTFFFRRRFLKILCACTSEVCIFLFCMTLFGDNSIITWIMRWITAAAACVLTVAVVNRINWKKGQPSVSKKQS